MNISHSQTTHTISYLGNGFSLTHFFPKNKGMKKKYKKGMKLNNGTRFSSVNLNIFSVHSYTFPRSSLLEKRIRKKVEFSFKFLQESTKNVYKIIWSFFKNIFIYFVMFFFINFFFPFFETVSFLLIFFPCKDLNKK